MPNYIFNNTAISNFAAVGRLDLLETHYRGIAFTTLAVSHEANQLLTAMIQTRYHSPVTRLDDFINP